MDKLVNYQVKKLNLYYLVLQNRVELELLLFSLIFPC